MSNTTYAAGFGSDLFDLLPEIAAERTALTRSAITKANQQTVDALTCIRDVMPEALEIVWRLEYWKLRDEKGSRASGPWAYQTTIAGVRFQSRVEKPAAGFWETWPANLVTWDQLRTLIGNDPRRAEISAWAESLTTPDRWKDWYRPYELWHEADGWHPSYIENDHARAGWAERLHAWQTTQQILTDAIKALS